MNDLLKVIEEYNLTREEIIAYFRWLDDNFFDIDNQVMQYDDAKILYLAFIKEVR